MADPKLILVTDENGEAFPAATPSLVWYVSRTGAARTQPVGGVENEGDGQFSLLPLDSDESVGTVALIDCGEGSWPRYQVLIIHTEQNPFAAFVPFDDVTGALSSGAPALGSYLSLDGGAALTATSVVQAGAIELYTVTPAVADSDRAIGVRLDAPASVLPHLVSVALLPSGGASPVVTVISAPSAPAGALHITVTDDSVVRVVALLARFSRRGTYEVVYDGSSWGPGFETSVMSTIEDGLDFVIRRAGGWPDGDVVFKAIAIDAGGNEST